MKSIRIIITILVLILFLSPACETDVDLVKAPEFIQKLVISSFISPSDKVTYFRVTSNKKLYGELDTEEPLGLLSGTISDGINEVALDTFKYGLKLNVGKMQIQYGKTYKLKVSNEKGLKAEAECIVPSKMNFVLEVDTFSVIREMDPYGPYPDDTYKSLEFKVTFNDIPGVDNFYRLYGKMRYYGSSWQGSDILIFNDNIVFSDKGMDGKSIILKTEQLYRGSLPTYDSMFVNIYLINAEKSYFSYHKSLEGYEDGENPFTEASPVFSNIIGGFGIFTSYTIDSLLVRFK